jgi:hypothetical protein
MAKVKLQGVRLSFPDLFEAVQYEGQGPFKYRASFLFEPNSDSHKALLAAMKEVAEEAWKDKAKSILAKADDDSKLRFIIDGNKKEYDGYKDMLAISATRDQAKGRPMVLNKKPKNPDGTPNFVTQTDGVVYGGCYVNATVELWAQNNKYGKTIRAQLLAVQFVKDGDAFGGGSAKGSPDDFEDLSDTGEDDDLISE